VFGQLPSVDIPGPVAGKKRVHPDPPCIWLHPTSPYVDVKGHSNHDIAYSYSLDAYLPRQG